MLPSVWFLSDTKASSFSSCLRSIISPVPKNVPKNVFNNKYCFCGSQVVAPCHVLSCQRGVTKCSALIKANSCNGALMSSWIFLSTINYQNAIMYQCLVSNCRFQALRKITAILKPSNCRKYFGEKAPMVILCKIKCLFHSSAHTSEETNIKYNVDTWPCRFTCRLNTQASNYILQVCGQMF